VQLYSVVAYVIWMRSDIHLQIGLLHVDNQGLFVKDQDFCDNDQDKD